MKDKPLSVWLSTLMVLLVFVLQSCKSSEEVRKTQEYESYGAVKILRKSIGTGKDQIGFKTPPEAMTIGPVSFAVAEDETIYIIDLANKRIQVYRNNLHLRFLPCPAAMPVDIDITRDGKVLILDNIVDKALFIIDGSNGSLINKLDLAGPGVGSPVEVSGIYYRASGPYAGVWATVEGSSVRLAHADGNPDSIRIMVPGRLNAGASKVAYVSIIGDATVMLYRSAEKFSEWEENSIFFDSFVVHILALAIDNEENAYLAAFLANHDEKDVVVKLNPRGEEVKRIFLIPQRVGSDIFHPIKIDNQGRVYQLLVEEDSVVVLRYVL